MKQTLQLIGFGCALALATGLTACSRSQPPAATAPKVTVTLPRTATVTNWDVYPGHLEAVEMVEVRPRVSGYIASIHFEDGADVQAGDLLFVIDPKPYQAELDRTRAERQRAETRVVLTRNDLQRAESLRGGKAISEEEYDTRRQAVREAEAALASASAQETNSAINLDYTRIVAPIRGRIGRRLVTPGNLVQGMGTATLLTTIVSQDPVYCYFDVDERAFLRYQKEQAARASAGDTTPLPCEIAVEGEDGFPHRGRVDFMDNQVDRQMGTLRVRGVFANAQRTLVPGLFARVRIPAGAAEPALLIPEIAILSDQDRKFVYVVNAENAAEPRPIVLGRAHGAARSVLAGLKPEDRVATTGLLLLRPGAKVEVVDSSTPAQASNRK